MSRNALKKHLNRCENMENRIIITIRARSKVSLSALEQLLIPGKGRNAGFALEHGIVSEVKPPSLPHGAVHPVLNPPK